MSPPGDNDLMVLARRVLLDALDALSDHRDVLIGAQAIYLHTRASSDPAGDNQGQRPCDRRRRLSDHPLINDAMSRAGFELGKDPGSWLSPMGVPVDLMIPESMSDPGGRRGGRIPPRSEHATRRASGLEAAMVDHAPEADYGARRDRQSFVHDEVAGRRRCWLRSCTSWVIGIAVLLSASTTRTRTTSTVCSSRSTRSNSRQRSRCCWRAISQPRRRVSRSAPSTTSSRLVRTP